eukprot:TRINITY_DN352_c0_g1_i1.p1 TRINITY_DN352_c0_g1~~TRINITY_DN352_c0_g1_i1.p1  ORF type:complete len:204 (-),score=57.08 TRINITY_DN352_c0_g1_i1:66-677(-)
MVRCSAATAAAVVVALGVAAAAAAAVVVGEGDGEGELGGGVVCGWDWRTYGSTEEAHEAGTRVLHCGSCGACSNEHDVGLYRTFSENLTDITRSCAWRIIFGDPQVVIDCHNAKVGLTSACMQCWIENIQCTYQHCLYLCAKQRLLGQPYVNEDGTLSECLQCDEDYCGGAFLRCGGANRRHACIQSNIARPDVQVCKSCEWD